jgi:gliding motility-associated transport system permease protein
LRATLAIVERELRAYFLSPVGYAMLTVFLLLSAVFFYLPLSLGEGSLRAFIYNVVIILIITLPALTMRLISEERRSGTIEILMTAPVTDAQVVMGKYLGSLGFYAVMLLATLQFPIALEIVSDPDRGPIITGYIGLLLFGGTFVAIGLLVSALTKSQVTAAFVTVGVLLLMLLLDWFSGSGTGWLAEIVNQVGMRRHLENFAKGIIDTRDVLYYLSVIALCLMLSTRALASWKWR